MHLAEEAHHPEVTVPRAMMTSFVVGTIGAFAMSVVLFYGITDVVAILNTTTGSLWIELVSSSSSRNAAKANISSSFDKRQAPMRPPLH